MSDPFDAYVRNFLAEKLGDVTPGQIVSFRFEAAPGYAYSEYTAEDFDCDIIVTVDQAGEDRERRVFLNEREMCEFLNGYGEAGK